MSESTLGLNARLMNVIGLIRLFGAGAPRGACAALRLELESGRWASAAEVATTYPAADWDGAKLVIPLDERHCAVVVFNYHLGIALIEYAGDRVKRVTTPSARGARR